MNLQEKFDSPTPRNWRIASLILKGIAIAATMVLPPLGVITVPLGASIAGIAILGSTACSFATKKDSLEAAEEVLNAISNNKKL